MSGLRARVCAAFVAPAASPLVPSSPRARAAVEAVTVIGTDAGLTTSLAAAVALTLQREPATAPLIACWAAAEAAPIRLPALGAGAATALAQRLSARDVPARPAGRAVVAQLSRDPRQAVAQYGQARGASAGPAVLALCGRRDVAFDGAIDDTDLVLLVAARQPDDPVTDLAARGLAPRRPPVVIAPWCPPRPSLPLAWLGAIRPPRDVVARCRAQRTVA